MTLKSRTFLITGANAGIGFAAAQRLAQAGATVIMACRSLERGEEARKKIIHNTGGGAIHLLQVDLASQPSIRAGRANAGIGFATNPATGPGRRNGHHGLPQPGTRRRSQKEDYP
jgi:NAD(P)-dependent dehydrogenase (short-subunit alcohol dehydrogenase family)